MGVDTSIASGTGKILIFTIRDVKVRLRVSVLLSETEIDDIDLVATFPDPHQEIIRFDVTMDEGLGVNVFDAGDKLIREEQYRLQGKLSVAEVEEILQAGSQKVEHHGVVVALGAKPAHEWNADTTGE